MGIKGQWNGMRKTNKASELYNMTGVDKRMRSNERSHKLCRIFLFPLQIKHVLISPSLLHHQSNTLALITIKSNNKTR